MKAGLDAFEKRSFLILLSSLLFISLMLTNFAYSFGNASTREDIPFVAQTMAVTNSTSPSDINSIQERLKLLFQQHAILAAETSINILEDRPEITDSQKMLDQNSSKIAGEVGRFVDNSNRTQFLTLWKQHLSLLADYANAVKNSDNTQKADASRSLDKAANALGNEFSQDNGLRDAVISGMKEHIDIEKGIIDAHYAGKFMTQYTLMNRALEHPAMMVDTIFDKLTP